MIAMNALPFRLSPPRGAPGALRAPGAAVPVDIQCMLQVRVPVPCLVVSLGLEFRPRLMGALGLCMVVAPRLEFQRGATGLRREPPGIPAAFPTANSPSTTPEKMHESAVSLQEWLQRRHLLTHLLKDYLLSLPGWRKPIQFRTLSSLGLTWMPEVLQESAIAEHLRVLASSR